MIADSSGCPVDRAPLVPLLLGAHWYRDDPGGLHRYLADLFEALRGAGAHPWAVVSGPAADAPVGVLAGGRFDRPFPIRLSGYTRTVNRAAAAGADVVDAHFAFYAFWPVVVGRLRRKPLVVHFQGPWAQESAASGEAGRWRIGIKKRLELSVYGKARTVIVLSAAFKRLLVEQYGIAPWNVEVVPPGVDLDRFVPAPDGGAAARRDLGLALDAPIVVAVRRLVPRMGLDVLLSAWGEVASALPGAQLLIVGEGPEQKRLRALARHHAPGGSVRFLGQVDEAAVVQCYQAADVSVVPTIALEGFGLVVLESLACGTPVVVTDAGGLPESVDALDRSLVVPAGDAPALAARLQGALDGTCRLPTSGQCRAHAETFSWPRIAERHVAVYRRATGAAHHPRRLRVVYLDHCARLSGGELALLRLLPSLDVDAHVILGEDGPLVAKLADAGISVEVLAIGGSTASLGRDRVRPGRVPAAALAQSGAYVMRLAHRLRRLHPDLVHTNSLKAALYGGAAGRIAGVPVVWHVRDRIREDYLPAAAVRLVRAAARILPTAIIANSTGTLETLGPAGAGGVVVPSPLGFAPQSPQPREPHAAAVPAAALRVGMVGRIDRWKGQHVFLDAFAKAFPDDEATAVLVGARLFEDDGYQQELDERVAALGLGTRVEFRGFCDDVRVELRGLDVLVHASTIPEPFGQVVIEGMAAGLPVVAAGAGGPAEVIEHGIDGLLYPPGDAAALAAALQTLAADPSLRRRLGDAASARVADFTPERIAPRVVAVYEAAVGSVARGASPR